MWKEASGTWTTIWMSAMDRVVAAPLISEGARADPSVRAPPAWFHS